MTAHVDQLTDLESKPIYGLEPLITEQQLSEILAVSVNTLSRWRQNGRAPRFLVLGPRRIGYRPSDVRIWMEKRARAFGDVFTASEPVAKPEAAAA
jgi:predicted DNA-binding transcriptional regulator AlpA